MSEPLNDHEAHLQERTNAAREDPRTTLALVGLVLGIEKEQAYEALFTLRYRATQEVFEAASALCRSECPQEREAGAQILNQLGIPQRAFPRESLALLGRMLGTEADTAVLAAVCFALGYLELPETVPLLVPFKGHPDAEVRFAVTHALAACEEPEAVAALIDLSEDSDSDVRDWATFGLGCQIDLDTPAVREALARRLEDADEDCRFEAMAGLARRKDSRAFAPVRAILADGDPSDYVLEAAAALGDPRLLPELLRLSQDPDYREHHRLREAIQRCRAGGADNPRACQ